MAMCLVKKYLTPPPPATTATPPPAPLQPRPNPPRAHHPHFEVRPQGHRRPEGEVDAAPPLEAAAIADGAALEGAGDAHADRPAGPAHDPQVPEEPHAHPPVPGPGEAVAVVQNEL